MKLSKIYLIAFVSVPLLTGQAMACGEGSDQAVNKNCNVNHMIFGATAIGAGGATFAAGQRDLNKRLAEETELPKIRLKQAQEELSRIRVEAYDKPKLIADAEKRVIRATEELQNATKNGSYLQDLHKGKVLRRLGVIAGAIGGAVAVGGVMGYNNAAVIESRNFAAKQAMPNMHDREVNIFANDSSMPDMHNAQENILAEDSAQ